MLPIGLMHKARAPVTLLESFETGDDFRIVGACDRSHRNGHRPNPAGADMWAANAFTRNATAKIWIGWAKGKSTRRLVYRIGNITVSDIGQCHQAWDIGVIHHGNAAEAVNFVSIDRTVLMMRYQRMLAYAGIYFVGEFGRFGREWRTQLCLMEQSGKVPQADYGHRIGGDQV